MKQSDSLFRRNGMLPVVLALVLAVAAAVATVEISAGLARDKLQEQADAEAKVHADYLNAVVSVNYLSTVWVINSFLSAFLTLDYDTLIVDGYNACEYTLKEETRQDLTVGKLREMVFSFIHYNYDFHSAMLIFEPGVIADAPADGLVLQAVPGDSVCHDLQAEGYNVMDGAFYQQVAQNNSMIVSSGSVSADSFWVSTFAVPIFNDKGKLLGQFWVDAEPEYTSDLLSRFSSKWYTIKLVVDDSMDVVASSNPEMNGLHLSEAMSGMADMRLDGEWYGQVSAGVQDDCKRVFRSEHGSEHGVVPICTYVFPVLASAYSLVVVQSEDMIYQSVNKFKRWLFLISVSGLIAILACISFIMYAFHRKTISNRRMASELRTASEIQQGILPGNSSPSELPPSLELYGYQHPAKQVGGDFYDYKLTGSRLCFCIGDVSGKGVPAALVMSQLCSLFRYVVRTETEPAAIVTSINKAVMDHSDDSVMCTLFVGTLDLSTGRLDYCNAGHTPPVFISDNAAVYLKVKPNIALYAFENWKYEQESMELHNGDRLFFYTDGVTETKNSRNVFFGDEATLKAVCEGCDKPFPELVRGVLDHIKLFAGSAQQHDDVTILCVGYHGPQSSVLHFDNVPKDVTGIVDEVLKAVGRKEDMRLRLALEEPLQNIADYAYDGQDGGVDIIVDPVNESGELTFTLIDSGVPFNPLEGAAPDLSLPLEQRQLGGLGIHFTRRIMKNLSYTYEQNRNHLKLIYQTTEVSQERNFSQAASAARP